MLKLNSSGASISVTIFYCIIIIIIMQLLFNK